MGRWVWLLAAWMLAACGGGDGGSGPPAPCAPGTMTSCLCPGGALGAQTCRSDGSGFGACDGCAERPDAGSALDTGPPCASGRQTCGGRCVNPRTDSQHCGACGTACAAGSGCMDGVCAAGCASPRAMCDGACVDPQSDANHCGGCGTRCPSGQTCLAGACACASGQAACDVACVDLRMDPVHCGRCGAACATGETCVDGSCTRARMRDCTNRECGPDGVGGSCGTCPLTGWDCNAMGRCVPPDRVCVPACAGRECGPDRGMYCDGRSCGTCPASSTCNASGRCVCTRVCAGRECGPDGCGGQCGTCAVGSICNAEGRCESRGCMSACDGRMCGPDPGLHCAGRTCGTCPAGFTCNGSGTGCVVSPSSRWVVTAVSGTASASPPSGGAWDTGGSPPDPYVCLTLDGAQTCTEYASDTFTPRWSLRARFPATTASALMAGVESVYADDDVGPDDPICAPGVIRFMAADFASRTRTFRCDPYGSFTLTLAPSP